MAFPASGKGAFPNTRHEPARPLDDPLVSDSGLNAPPSPHRR